MNQIIDCKAIAKEILDEVKAVPNKKALVVISFGENKEAESYLKGLRKDCAYCGVELLEDKRNEDLREPKARSMIAHYRMEDTVGGILILEPVPNKLRLDVVQAIKFKNDKDVDGFADGIPCIAEAVLEILKTQYDDLTGKNALVVGRGRAGKAVAEMLLEENCTLTIVHSKTDKRDFPVFVQDSDIIVSAVGKPVIDCTYCFDSTIIDCGTSVDENGEIEGDLYNIEKLSECNFTPVPNGVGLVTRAVLLRRLAEN